ncbi:uncharacterized protein LOC144141305 [Haemaphysalis longicornis]
MPRVYKRKHPDRAQTSNNLILDAVRLVCDEKKSIRDVAESFEISKSSLGRAVKKYRECGDTGGIMFKSNLVCGMVFTTEDEVLLKEYLLKASKMHYGLTRMQVRSLAYEFATALNRKCPASWEQNKVAGRDWFMGFMDRHPELSLRSPEATSLGRATSFNKNNVDAFLSNLKSVYDRYKLTPDRISNCDETGFTTAHNPPKVVAARGEKQIGQVTSAERGELVTVLCTVNAIGNALPPVFIFPRVRFKDFFLKGAPAGSLGLASKSGWMSSELFLLALKHTVRHTKCSKEEPILLILDNHESHVSINTINKAKESGVILLTFPPHCSHRLQPLDVSVYGPFKSRYNAACNDWLINNPGKTISIHNVAQLVGSAYVLTVTQKNIISGFQKTGIWPFNSEPFTSDDYMMSSVTDRPEMSVSGEVSRQTATITEKTDSASRLESDLNFETNGHGARNVSTDVFPPTVGNAASTSTASPSRIVPSDLRPYPKAAPRKTGQKGRKKGRTKVLTDTPEKHAIEQEAAERLARQSLKKRALITAKTVATTRPKKKRRLQKEFSSSSEDDTVAIAFDDSDSDMSGSDNERRDISEADCPNETFQVKKGDFVLVRFGKKKSDVYYTGRVESSDNIDVSVQFLRKKEESSKFYFPQQKDIGTVPMTDIVMKLPGPKTIGGTKRLQACFKFDVELSAFNVR